MGASRAWEILWEGRDVQAIAVVFFGGGSGAGGGLAYGEEVEEPERLEDD